MTGLGNFIIDFLDYLKEYEGFSVSEDTASFILSSISSASLDITEEEEIMNILRLSVCKTAEQYNSFPAIFHFFFTHQIEINTERKKKEIKVNSLRKKLENLKKESEQGNRDAVDNPFENMAGRASFLKKTEKNRKALERLINEAKITQETKVLLHLLCFNKSCEHFSDKLMLQVLENIKSFIKEAAFKAALMGNKEVIEILKKAKSVTEKEVERIKEQSAAGEGKKAEMEAIQSELDQLLKKMSDGSQIYKKQSMNHREVFLSGHNCVNSSSQGDIIFSKNISNISKSDMESLLYYIRKNAKRFKTQISKNIRSDKRLKYDVKNIVKKACSTDGVPLRLIFRKSIENKPKLVLFLDVSGSCSAASRLMLLFIYYLKQAFAGGCEAYVFVNSLHNITSFMNAKVPTDAADKVLASIPTRGVYSDYYTPLKSFYDNNMSSVNKNTIVMFIGDARNNRNASGEEYIKAISRKSRACFWLNTEDENKWDTGDSIVSCYSRYMQETLPVLTVGDLVNFVTNFRVKKGFANGSRIS